MAKRRKLEAPSAEDLSRIEAELAGGGAARLNPAAPIAQVAAESAGAFDP
ncbi:chromosome partitioning protein ParB, partial [Pseudooceanicola lipolyticus]